MVGARRAILSALVFQASSVMASYMAWTQGVAGSSAAGGWGEEHTSQVAPSVWALAMCVSTPASRSAMLAW